MMIAAVLNKGSPGKRILWLAVFLLILLAASPAFAATYYVSPSGSDSNNGTSEASAFRTIQKGANVARAGDTVTVLPGTYNEAIQSKNNGTASARIRFVSKERWGAKVTGRNSSYAWMNLGTYVDIEGFDVTGGSNALTGIGLLASYSRALYNHVHNIRSANCDAGGGGITGGKLGSEGVEMIGNVVHDVGAFSPALPYCNHVHTIYMATPHGKVQNNIVYHSASAGIHLWHAPTDSIVSHNLSFSNRGPGIIYGCGDAPHIPCRNIMVYNNIVMNNEGYGIREYGNNSGARVVNNILYGNLKDTPTMMSGAASGNLSVNPKLKNFQPNGSSNIEDYRPAAGSPAIDAAATDCAGCNIASDIVLGVRPFGPKPDIGPLEYGATPGVATPPIPGSGGGTGTTPPGTNPCPPAGSGDTAATPPAGGEPAAPTPTGGTATATGPGKTYYVSTTGSDSNNGTSEGSAFKTIQKGADVAKAGDTVMVMPGTYIETARGGNFAGVQNKNDGTATNRIRFVSKVKWGAKVSARGGSQIWASLGDYVDIEGFDIDGSGSPNSPGITAYGTSARILYNHVHNLRPMQCVGVVGIGTNDYEKNFGVEIIGNVIHDIGPGVTCPKVRGYGIYLSTNRGKVQNNIVYNNGSYGIHLWHTPIDAIVSHNLVFNNGRSGILFGCGDKPFVTCKNIVISNNILMNNKEYAIQEYGNNNGTNRVVNNITFGDSSKIGMKNGQATGNMVGVDPKLVNFRPNGGGDYHPAPGSPAIDKASPTGAIANDIDLGKRPFGAASDIGPYEAGATPGTTPLPPPAGGGATTPPPGTNPCAVCDPKQEIDVIINDTVCAPAGAAVPVSIEIVDALTGQPAPLCRDVYVGPIPYGFTLSAGTVYENRTGGVIYKLTPAELLNLTITPPAGYSGALVLHVSYTPPPL